MLYYNQDARPDASILPQLRADKDQLDRTIVLFNQYRQKRPSSNRNLDQFWATEETVLRRTAVLGGIKDIRNKRVLFLGDDDLTSLVFATFYRAAVITVVDIDKRLIDFLTDVARKEGLSIEFIEHDLRDPLPRKKFENYDVVFFDPPYTPPAVQMWLTRAMEATLGSGANKKRKGIERLSSKTYLMCYGYTDRGTERGLEIQRIITSLGLVIQDKARAFNRYYGAKSIGSVSDLYSIQPTPKLSLERIDKGKSRFYTGQKINNK